MKDKYAYCGDGIAQAEKDRKEELKIFTVQSTGLLLAMAYVSYLIVVFHCIATSSI